MSTNKTPNYQLHSWLPTDDFRFHEINENFTKLDQNLKRVDSSAARMVSGTYIGPGSGNTLTVTLGFRPQAVFAMVTDSEVYDPAGPDYYIAFTADSQSDCGLTITATGFIVSSINRSRMAAKDIKFNYFALR